MFPVKHNDDFHCLYEGALAPTLACLELTKKLTFLQLVCLIVELPNVYTANNQLNKYLHRGQ